jgi:hypothetical protein
LFINSFYYKNNIINNSPVHALERIFGIESSINEKEILTIDISKKNISNILIITIHVDDRNILFLLVNILKNIKINFYDKITILSSSSIEFYQNNGINEYIKKNISLNKLKKINIQNINLKCNYSKLYRYIRRIPKKRQNTIFINFDNNILKIKEINNILEMFFLSFMKKYDFIYYLNSYKIILFKNNLINNITTFLKNNLENDNIMDNLIKNLNENKDILLKKIII